LVLYGLGTTIGAGIFVLIGQVTGLAGAWTPLAFILAALLILPTAFAFAELSARFPKAAGEAIYVAEAFGRRGLALAIALLVAAAAIVAAATVVRGAAGYVGDVVAVPGSALVVGLVVLLGGIAAWGIRESAWIVGLITMAEIAVLVAVIAAGFLAAGAAAPPATVPAGAATTAAGLPWHGILAAAGLAFFAFIGFEDIVNVAEEAHAPERTLPAAILITLVVTTLLYLGVAVASLAVLAPVELAASPAPLARVWEAATGGSAHVLAAIAAVSTLNGALILTIRAARVLYGAGREGWLPAALARVHPWTRTPLVATAVATALVLAAALTLPLLTLANLTTVAMLAIFTSVNLALVALRRREGPPADAGRRAVPIFVPVAGAAVSLAMLLFLLSDALGFAAAG